MRGRGAVALAAAVALAGARISEAREPAEVVPEAVTVGGRALPLAGSAVQRQLWFRIYTVALYLEAPVAGAAQAIAADRPKAIRLVLHHRASRSQMASALRDGMRSAGVDLEALQPRLDRLLAAIPDMQAGEWLQIDYLPGKGTVLWDRRGRSLRLAGKDFADALFSIWLGEAPEMARIRRGLLGAGRPSRPSRP